MARIGKLFFVGAMLLAAWPAWAEVEFYMTADRTKVGLEDTFRVEIVISGAPDNSRLSYPEPVDFEVLGRNQSSQMQYVLSGGMSQIKRTEKHVLTVRASKLGRLKIPAALLTTSDHTYKTDSLSIEVVKGRLQQEAKRAPAQNPFGFPPGFPFAGLDDDPFEDQQAFDETDIPSSDSDLFLRTSMDKKEAYIGEQVTLTFSIFSRIDLQQVDGLTLPKLDGFWTVDSKAAKQLQGEQRIVNGIPYRVFLLQQRTIFPMKAGVYTLEPAEVDITTGNYFQGRKVHRKGNALSLSVKALPPTTNKATGEPLVGRWRLTREVNQTNLAVGEPLQMKVVIAGQGNLQALPVLPIGAPSSFKTFDPVPKDVATPKGPAGGQRIIEYTMVPQQTGTFTLPSLSIQYFDPQKKEYAESSAEPVTVTVSPSANGASLSGSLDSTAGGPGAKNQLVSGGLKSLRHTAHFSEKQSSWMIAPWFLPAALAPLVLSFLFGVFGLVRGVTQRETEETLRKKQTKESKRRLKKAQALAGVGSAPDFYGEVDVALTKFLEAHLGVPLSGLTREALDSELGKKKITSEERLRILKVFETCDLGRYAPGMGLAERQATIDAAAEAMENLS
jgi:hypothetical protein